MIRGLFQKYFEGKGDTLNVFMKLIRINDTIKDDYIIKLQESINKFLNNNNFTFNSFTYWKDPILISIDVYIIVKNPLPIYVWKEFFYNTFGEYTLLQDDAFLNFQHFVPLEKLKSSSAETFSDLYIPLSLVL